MRILVVLMIIQTFLLTGCQSQPVKLPQRENIVSPLGIYVTNTTQKYWLAILREQKYLICSPSYCQTNSYQTVAVNYGVILLDFFVTEHGEQLERLSHGSLKSEAFYQSMKNNRMQLTRPNDLAFNIRDCQGIPCAGIGHVRDGVKFYKVENFDEFWVSNLSDVPINAKTDGDE